MGHQNPVKLNDEKWYGQYLLNATSRVHALWVGYFASEMNAHKSLGGVVRSMWYAVVITCRGHY